MSLGRLDFVFLDLHARAFLVHHVDGVAWLHGRTPGASWFAVSRLNSLEVEIYRIAALTRAAARSYFATTNGRNIRK